MVGDDVDYIRNNDYILGGEIERQILKNHKIEKVRLFLYKQYYFIELKI